MSSRIACSTSSGDRLPSTIAMCSPAARAQRMETSQEVGAALTAVGAAAGWGRIKACS